MVKIVLVNPSFEPIYIYKKNKLEDVPNVPRAVLTLGTYLKQKGHEVKIIDARIEDKPIQKTVEEAKNADFVGFGVMSSQITNALKISDAVKKYTKAKTVWGGIHPTLFTEQTCQDPTVDFVIHGEGDEALLELMEGIEPNKIKNVAYKKNGKVIVNSRRDYFDINKIPQIDFDLIDVEKHINRTLVQERRKVRMLPVVSSRGCPHRCAFCIHVICDDRRYRTQDVDTTVNEIKRLKEKYHIHAFAFAEDNFFVNRQRVKDILEKIKHLGLKWECECRADYFRPGHVDEELLKLMKESGCAGFTIGAESGCPKTLKVMKKDITPEQIVNSAKICYKYGFVPAFSFIVGLPGETRKDALMTVRMIEKVVKECPIMIGGIGLYRPYPGGELYDYCFKIGNLKNPDSLREWTSQKYLDLMISASNIPWNKDSDYMKKLNFYCGLYFFTNRRLAMYIKRDPFLGLGFAFFVLLARLRVKTKFFHLPIDRKLFGIATRLSGREYIMNFAFGKRKKVRGQARVAQVSQ